MPANGTGNNNKTRNYVNVTPANGARNNNKPETTRMLRRLMAHVITIKPAAASMLHQPHV